MKAFYFRYPKYVFLLFLIYLLNFLTTQQGVSIGAKEIVLVLIFPFVPVLISFYFARELDKDLVGSMLNVLSLATPLLVLVFEVFIITTLSLQDNGSVLGPLFAFAGGAAIYYVLFCLTLMLSVFAKTAYVGK